MTTIWSRGGLQLKARARFDPRQHPRDVAGRFIETGATVAISPIIGGGQGTVVANSGNGYIEVARAGGQRVRVHRSYLTVVAGPGGAAPTADPAAAAAQPAQAPAAPDATPAEGAGGGGGTGVPVVKYRHPSTGEPVAPVKDKRGSWHMVNPKLIDVSGRDHVAAYSLARDGTVGEERTLRPAGSFDLSTVGTFSGAPKAPVARGQAGGGPPRPGRRGPLPGAGGDPLEPWQPVFSDSDLSHMRRRTGELQFSPPSGLNAEEKQILELLHKGHDFRLAYAEVFGIGADDLALLERASLIDVDRIARATGDPAKARLYDEFVYLTWIDAVRKSQDRAGSTGKPARPQAKASPAGLVIPEAAITEAALAGQFAAASGLPPTACPFDPAGPPVTAAQAVAFVHAYVTAARRKKPSEGTVSP